ncbi:MAG: hypothetical protein WCT77_02905 [Bacteroidota bacterium]
MLNYNTIEVGDQVHWTGSEDDGYQIYEILEKGEDAGPNTVLIIGDGYSEYEVFLCELF